MADDDMGMVIGSIIFLTSMLIALSIVLLFGAIIGAAVGSYNYCKAIQTHVRLERPGA